MRTPIAALALLASLTSIAQDICGFLDYRNYFYVFDHGTIKELEHLPPIAFANGGGYMVYASAGGEVKVYRDGEATVIDQGIATRPTITDHYFGYASAGVLEVYDGKELLRLCNNTGRFVVEDSVVGFYDEVQRTLHIHYRGNPIQVEDALIGNPLEHWSAGDNTIAWVTNNTKEFKVFHRGEVTVLASQVTDLPFTAGLDIVAYQDPTDQGLKAYYDGEVIDVDPFMPDKIYMGRGLFAFIDRAGALKVFQGGQVYTALEFTPDEFVVKDSLVVIRDKGYCKIFHNGSTVTVTPYWPSRWEASWGTFVWLDNDMNIQRWNSSGVKEMMQREPIKEFSFDRGLLKAVLTNNAVKILWHDQLYEH